MQQCEKYFLKYNIPQYNLCNNTIHVLALAHSLMHTLEEEIFKQQDTK